MLSQEEKDCASSDGSVETIEAGEDVGAQSDSDDDASVNGVQDTTDLDLADDSTNNPGP